MIGQGSPYNQQSASVSGLLQAFVDSVFPDLKEGLQEIVTKQFTIHMETFAEEQLRFAEALCRDFKSILPEEIRENRSHQIPVSEVLRLENTLPTHTSQSTMLMGDGDPNCSPQDIVQGVSKLLEKKAPVISGIITKASKRSLATASRRDSRRLEESALIVLNDENDNVIDALVKRKGLTQHMPRASQRRNRSTGKASNRNIISYRPNLHAAGTEQYSRVLPHSQIPPVLVPGPAALPPRNKHQT